MEKSVARYDKGDISKTIVTDEGYIKGQAIVTRTGVFLYRNADGTIRRELRHPDDVLKSDSLETMKLIPITDGHPIERLVTSSNSKRLASGYTGENISHDGSYIYSNLIITDSQLVQKIQEKHKNELSLGYTVDLEEEKGVFDGEEYDYRQTNIKYNHLAVVDEARAGPKARIALDRLDAVEISQLEETMTQKKVKIDEDEVLLEPAAAETVEKALENRDEEVERLKAELERVKAERDMLKEKLEAKEELSPVMEAGQMPVMDRAEISKIVRERVKLEKLAEGFLDKDKLTKIDSMDDIEIKKAIILADQPKANLDGKSEIYITARFDGIIEQPRQEKTPSKPTKIDMKDNSRADLEAQKRMIARLTNKGA